MKCLVCEKELKFLAPKHLKKHGLTTEEYKKKFNCNSLVDEGFSGKFQKDKLKEIAIKRGGECLSSPRTKPLALAGGCSASCFKTLTKKTLLVKKNVDNHAPF